MPVDHSEFRIVKSCDATAPLLSSDGLAVDPNNPNADVDGRDFLVWQRSLPPAQTDDGLLLPAVRMDEGEAGKGADYSGSHILYQDVTVPAATVATEALAIAHAGFLLT